MKKITVIITCYNGYQYMGNCLSSLENQTYKDFKVVIIDDCSTDDSYQQLLEYQKNTQLDMVVQRNEKNLRCALSRLAGIKLADTPWVCFCDCDDWYEIDHLEKMLTKAETTETDIVMCHFNYAYADGTKKYLTGLNILNDDSSKEEFMAFTPMSLCRFLFKRHLYEDLVVPHINSAEDGAVTPQLLAKGNKISIIHEGLYNYFIRENSLSSLPKPSIYYDYLVAQSVIDENIGQAYPQECEFIAIKNFCYGAILNGIKAGIEMDVIKKDYADFLQKHPNWHKNKYMFSLSRTRKIFLSLLKRRMFLSMRLFAIVHRKLSV